MVDRNDLAAATALLQLGRGLDDRDDYTLPSTTILYLFVVVLYFECKETRVSRSISMDDRARNSPWLVSVDRSVTLT